MAKKKKTTKRGAPKRAKRKRTAPATPRAIAKKLTALERGLDRTKEVTASVLETEIERSKQIAVEVRQQLRQIQKDGDSSSRKSR